jgi:hypothetical protein
MSASCVHTVADLRKALRSILYTCKADRASAPFVFQLSPCRCVFLHARSGLFFPTLSVYSIAPAWQGAPASVYRSTPGQAKTCSTCCLHLARSFTLQVHTEQPNAENCLRALSCPAEPQPPEAQVSPAIPCRSHSSQPRRLSPTHLLEKNRCSDRVSF